ncbi:STAS domain-containing protein [Paraglaciecola sp.]|uniref:STAS domain-containing protein n=1 Tax=Paraglaciecola sp. TaxID=1920173 RepID=UPI003EF0EE03
MKELKLVVQKQGHFELSGDLNRETVPFCKQQTFLALKAFNQASPSEKAILDMSGIEHSDTAGLAWLINLLKYCKQHKILLQLKNIPQTIVNLAKISDVDNFLSVQ